MAALNDEKLVFESSEAVKIVSTFDDFGLEEDLLHGIYAYNFEKPSAIQQRAILPIIKGRDVIAQAQSGTGKTAAFSISILQSIDTSLRETQALVLSPTRELATQIQFVILALGDYMNVQCHACVGGTSIGEDIRKLDRGQHVVSGTPGRVFDMIRRRNLRTRNIKVLVLDEADELLNKGFKDQIYDIYRYLPPSTQVVVLSTTLPYDVLEMTTKFMTDPIRILVKRDELTLENIKQFFVAVEIETWKFDTLCDLYETLTITQAVIFCNTRRKVKWLTEKMRAANFTIASMFTTTDDVRILRDIEQYYSALIDEMPLTAAEFLIPNQTRRDSSPKAPVSNIQSFQTAVQSIPILTSRNGYENWSRQLHQAAQTKRLCRGKDIKEIASIFSQLSTTRFSEGDDIERWSTCIHELYEALLDTRLAVSEAVVCQFMIQALPTSFANVVSTLQALPDEEWNITSFTAHIRLYCTRLQRTDEIPSTPGDSVGLFAVPVKDARIQSPAVKIIRSSAKDSVFATETVIDNQPLEEPEEPDENYKGMNRPGNAAEADSPGLLIHSSASLAAQLASHGEASHMEDIGIHSDEKLSFECSEGVKVISTFDELGLKGDLLRGIYAYNFEKPTAVQQHSFLSITKGHNIIVQAPSGTGKTATFAISVLQSIDTSLCETQALVLLSTRELASQIHNALGGKLGGVEKREVTT
ncbi:unnamed protein product [Rhizoctonia solani]|uniref:Uncharacterized protein n=1 Tax=Rhizoctonia solani TaxID=456999 RepID=A0A8H2Y1R4_9AGAM|nr:unnamed protein product [Rhizoctonia solani]